ncbi:MAG: YggT family protein [Hyphomicrobiales bacterium]|nr:YggT family protein [Hyphomicrobiales bacterium]MCY4049559.1 YggT family protein [Hyphomicrobiales bacterium]MCY4054056.1 YggT family protein [Hyphomicrobiales bacterium]
MIALLELVNNLIQVYIWVIIASAVFSWLVAFNLVNTGNRFIASLGYLLHRLTDPPLRLIRSFLPNIGAIDISPVILILALIFLRELLWRLWLTFIY